MWTSSGSARVAVGNADVIIRPSVAMEKMPGVIFVHGAGEGALSWMSISLRIPIFKSLAGAGFTVLATDLGGPQTWGNDSSQAGIMSSYNYLQTLPDVLSGPVFLLGQSMGGLASFIWAANNKDKVLALSTILPVTNLENVHARGDYHTDLINAAYGVAYNEASMGAKRNPIKLAQAGSLSGVKAQIWYGLGDTLCRPVDATTLGGLLTRPSMRPVPGGHTEETTGNIQGDAIASFFTDQLSE